MKLYFSPGACSLAPHIVLRESGAVFELEKVDLASHQTISGADFFSISPKGQVPLLVLDDGEILSEGVVISQFIADQLGNRELMPAAGSMARYRVMEWQNYITSELHKSFASAIDAEFDAATKRIHIAHLRKKYEWVNTVLADTDYLTGQNFTAADAYLFVVSNWAKYVNLDIADLAHVQAFMRRVTARPAVREAMKAEGLF